MTILFGQRFAACTVQILAIFHVQVLKLRIFWFKSLPGVLELGIFFLQDLFLRTIGAILCCKVAQLLLFWGILLFSWHLLLLISSCFLLLCFLWLFATSAASFFPSLGRLWGCLCSVPLLKHL